MGHDGCAEDGDCDENALRVQMRNEACDHIRKVRLGEEDLEGKAAPDGGR